LLDACRFVDDADALYAERATQGEFTRGLGNTPIRVFLATRHTPLLFRSMAAC